MALSEMTLIAWKTRRPCRNPSVCWLVSLKVQNSAVFCPGHPSWSRRISSSPERIWDTCEVEMALNLTLSEMMIDLRVLPAAVLNFL